MMFGLDDDLTLAAPRHCGQQFKHKSTRYGWEGEYEKSAAFFACPGCGLQLAIETKRHIGPVPA